jgi:branched-chain amino acid aminotransferase
MQSVGRRFSLSAIKRSKNFIAPNLTRCGSSSVDASKLEITRTTTPKAKTPYEDLQFGVTMSDHMLEVDWSEKDGWSNPVIRPYQNFSISPAASVFHYGIECFEGMKAYKDTDGNIRMFRPDCNMERMNYSMKRLCLPGFDGEQFIECIKELLRIDESWIPDKDGYSMYIRPTAIGTQATLGVSRSLSCKIYCIMSPVGPYYKSGFKPIKLLANTQDVRAWPGGVGNAKLGGNYGPTIAPATKAIEQGCEQILWLFGEEQSITEVGAMNIFFVIKNAEGKSELITGPLTRGDILPGVTRRSILELARDWAANKPEYSDLVVTERFLSMKEVKLASDEGRLMEAFGAGTAVVIAPVKGIVYEGSEIIIPTGEEAGPLAQSIWTAITDIQYGRAHHDSWSVKL